MSHVESTDHNNVRSQQEEELFLTSHKNVSKTHSVISRDSGNSTEGSVKSVDHEHMVLNSHHVVSLQPTPSIGEHDDESDEEEMSNNSSAKTITIEEQERNDVFKDRRPSLQVRHFL